MIKSFSSQVVFCFAIPEPYLLMLAKLIIPVCIYQKEIVILEQFLG